MEAALGLSKQIAQALAEASDVRASELAIAQNVGQAAELNAAFDHMFAARSAIDRALGMLDEKMCAEVPFWCVPLLDATVELLEPLEFERIGRRNVKKIVLAGATATVTASAQIGVQLSLDSGEVAMVPWNKVRNGAFVPLEADNG